MVDIYTAIGEHDRAIDEHHMLLSIPSPISPMRIRVDPAWAPLRDNPRFAELVAR